MKQVLKNVFGKEDYYHKELLFFGLIGGKEPWNVMLLT